MTLNSHVYLRTFKKSHISYSAHAVLIFLCKSRSRDYLNMASLVSEGNLKGCDCPASLFMERETIINMSEEYQKNSSQAKRAYICLTVIAYYEMELVVHLWPSACWGISQWHQRFGHEGAGTVANICLPQQFWWIKRNHRVVLLAEEAGQVETKFATWYFILKCWFLPGKLWILSRASFSFDDVPIFFFFNGGQRS